MGRDAAAEAMRCVDELEQAMRRLEFRGMVGPQVHNLAERFRPMFFGVRQQIEAWERTRQAREDTSGG